MSSSEGEVSVLLRMKREQREQLQGAAKAQGMSMNSYVLYKTLEATPTTPNAYVALENQVQTLNKTVNDHAALLANLEGQIAQGKGILGREES